MKWFIAILIGLLFVLSGCPDGKKDQVKDENKLEEPKDPEEKTAPTIDAGEVKVKKEKKEKKAEE
jgi:hypothetical protein